ncbi:MAG TPA: hypothetical protein VHE83_02680 [Mycobacteriales bacterium]|nr:hypothetical protein [Mycobacteriales bacterium]
MRIGSRRGAGAALLTGALLLVAPAVAHADDVDDAVSSLRTHHVFVADGAEAASLVDGAKLADLIGGADIRIAVLPAAAQGNSTAQETVQRLQAELGDESDVVIGIVGRKLGVEAGSRAPVSQSDGALIVSNAYGRHSDGGFTKANVEGALEDIVSDVKAAASAAGGSASTDEGGSGDNGHHAAVVGFFVVLAVGVAGLWFGLRRHARKQRTDELASARADVESLYNRLGSDVSTLDPGEDKVAKQAMADASERYTATGATLASAKTLGELAAARRSAIEGIQAARVVRKQLGLDEGPDPQPLAPANAPQVQGRQTIAVGNQTYTGHGAYTPGSPYYFGGGTYGGSWVPGGWYATPFWEQLLITEAVFGGFGGWDHGGYDAGWSAGQQQGYDQGHDQGHDQGQHSWGGGDWGSGAGSSWGDDSHAGDWGGGDWGGGGADWGGGGDSGGGGDGGGGGSW